MLPIAATRCGEYGRETDLGGFNENALAGCIAVALDDLGVSLEDANG
jgi:hypothetical protein